MISGQKIAIYGIGLEGISAAKYLAKKNEISLIDDKERDQIDKDYLKEAEKLGLQFFFNSRDTNVKFDTVVRSPGVSPKNKTIEKLLADGARLTSATKIFFDDCLCEIIAVTGTKGKGTTSTLIYDLLKTQSENVYLAGNIGTPMLDLLNVINHESKVVLELSSFQLIDLHKSPHVAVVLMTTSEHLDWHTNQEEYLDAKSNIVKFQNSDDFAVINADFPNSVSLSEKTKAKKYFFSTKMQTNGVYKQGNNLVSEIQNREVLLDISDIKLPGAHNIQNVAATVAVAKIYDVQTSAIQKTVKKFKGLPHRLQLTGEKNGVKYYNDSFSTTPETTIAAIEAFGAPKILVLGGSSKNSDFTQLVAAISRSKSIKAIIFIGKEGEKIRKLLTAKNFFKEITGLKKMTDIVTTAAKNAEPGDVVLLSPACASFGLFKNYKDRGEQFTQAVNSL